MKKLLLCLGILFFFMPLAAQTLQFETSEEIKSGSQNPLLAIGEKDGKIYMAHIGSGKKVSEYKVLEFESNNLKQAPREMELGTIFPEIKNHDAAYFFLQHGQIYVITISNSQYFGNIMSLEGKNLKSNISLYGSGMSKTTVGFAEMQETIDKEQLVLIYKKGTQENLKEIGLIVFDANLATSGSHSVKLPAILIKPTITDLYYAKNACLYMAFFSEKTGGQAHVYATASKELISYDLSGQDNKLKYHNGRFHEGPDGRVWLGFSKGEETITSYSMFVHNGGTETPVMVENYAFSAQIQKTVRLENLIGKSKDGLPLFTEMKKMVFAADGKMYAIFEPNVTHYHPKDQSGNGLNLEYWTLFSLDLVCVTLDASGKAMSATPIYKAQKLVFVRSDQKKWTLGRDDNFDGQNGKTNTHIKALSFYAYASGGKLHILYNDDRKNEAQNEDKPNMVDNLGKINLVHISVDGAAVEKEIVIESDTYELIFLPLLAMPFENGRRVLSATGSKKGGQTGLAVVTLY